MLFQNLQMVVVVGLAVVVVIVVPFKLLKQIIQLNSSECNDSKVVSINLRVQFSSSE
jgi:hypothetical protein